jgi:hypothetical protein
MTSNAHGAVGSVSAYNPLAPDGTYALDLGDVEDRSIQILYNID